MEGATQESFHRDKAQCYYEASAATASIRSGIEAGFQQGHLEQLCMQARGYDKVPMR